jgi:predicted nucleotide-binding protein (sugar kinase/HSP70/actin superfamily)
VKKEFKQPKVERPVFTKEMKKTHTILVPTMLPIHFGFLANIFRQEGYTVEVLSNTGRAVVEEGLKNVHNDTCYPALLVIGQLIDALNSGKYDLNRVALLISQTGGGCRASNYIHLLRKALQKSGYGHIPVISLNMGGLESNPGFKITLPMVSKLVYAVLLGDLLMLLSNQCRPYEYNKGDTDKVVEKWQNVYLKIFATHKVIRHKDIKAHYRAILEDFDAIPRSKEKKIRVGVVGEIYVKYSPLGNNNLEQFLQAEGAEVVVPGLMDFLLYCVCNIRNDHILYGGGYWKAKGAQLAYQFLTQKENVIIQMIKEHGVFMPPTPFDHVQELGHKYINRGVKMGEGWLLTAEMAELIEEGVNNIVCTQPFGCLPNHVAGKGMMHVIKEKHPDANIVAVDYDPGASEVNQQNRIKLMLANAAMIEKQKAAKEAAKKA